MGLVGRSAELGELAAHLDRAAAGFGGVITLVGTAGSGKSALAARAAALARDRGFEIVGGAPVRGRPGRLVWAGLLDDLDADPEVTAALLDDTGPPGTNMAVRLLAAGTRRLIVVDDVDLGGQEAVDVLALVAARLVTCSTAVVATAATPLGVGTDLKLGGLCEHDLAAIVGEMPAEQRHAVWVASRGMPDAAHRGRPHLRRGAEGRRTPAGIHPHRAGMPLRPCPRRPIALERVTGRASADLGCERIVRTR
jgi:hypothetical protein